MKISIISLFFFATITNVFCQKEGITITPIPNTLFENPSADIQHMTQDEFGHIWMAHSVNGIVRYDGENMVWYAPNPDNPDAIVEGRLEEMLIDNRGHIWISTVFDGIELFDLETEIFTHIRHDPDDPKSIRSNIVRAFIQDDEGFIWLGTTNGLDKYDPKTGEFIHVFSKDPDFKTIDNESIWELYQDKSGIIWIGCGTAWNGNDRKTVGGLFKYDKKTDEITQYSHTQEANSLIDNRISALFEDSRGTFWVGTAGDGLHTMDREQGTFERHEYDPLNPQKISRPPLDDIIDYADDHITFIDEDEFGNIWIGTLEGGINRYNPLSGITTYFGMDEFGTKSFFKCTKTYDNILWFVAWTPSISGEGLFKVNTSPQKLHYTDLGLGVRSMVETEDKSILLGTRQGLILMDSNAHIQNISFNNEFLQSAPRINHLNGDKSGNIWISTQQGLYHHNNLTKEITTYRHDPDDQNSISSDDIHKTLLIDEDHILIGTGEGLNILNLEDGICQRFFHDRNDVNKIEHDDISGLKQDHNGNIWIGTEGGINKFNKSTGLFKQYADPFIAIRTIFEDSKNHLWVGTRGKGLWLYDEESDLFKLYLDKTGILTSLMDVFEIMEDRDNNLWIKTNLGFVRLNPSNGNAILFGRSWGETFSQFWSRGILATSTGDILIGNRFGFVRFNPNDYKQELKTIDPYINKFYMDNQLVIAGSQDYLSKPISQTNEITLKWFQNDFGIGFGHVDFRTAAVEHVVQFRLENYDDDWRENEGVNKVSYYRVPPGKYNFQVRASNINGIWTKKSVAITILIPWYKSWWACLMFVLLSLSALRAFIQFRARKLIATNKQLEEKVKERTQELETAKVEVENTLNNLKSTQAQLIQSEKMASLGELTAGIAHEIQNPLNFVNNFSDVSGELIDEALEELDNDDIAEAKDILSDLKGNLEKISHHGRRASGIVKGMLDHSRASSGEKVPIDINALCDEYLRLSYHDLRTKDKSFNAEYKMDFDPNLPLVNVIPQDIGRVLLNLINNAFYAIHRKAINSDSAYTSKVTIATTRNENGIEISVSDNGDGIPDSIKEKIFQPFFTTKPTGQGTGLGLSLSYDIVKAHGGELTVETKAGEGSKFIINLPLTKDKI